MLDLDTQAVTGWLQAIQPARSDSDWPPPVRAIESTGTAPDLFKELSQVIGRHQADDGHHLAVALSDPAAVALLRSVLAQLGAARMLRIVSALSDLLPDGETTARPHIQADLKVILQPTSVHALTCLDNILYGVGRDVITNILNPMTLLNAIKGQICSAITST